MSRFRQMRPPALGRHGQPWHDGPHPPSIWQVLTRPADTGERNQRNVLIDAIGVGLAAGIGTYLSVFLVRLGASSFLVGLLTAMPAFTGMVLAMPIGEFLSRQRHIVPWFSTSRLFVLSCYALTGLVPFLVRDHQPEAIILIWAVATLPQTVVNVAFTVVMGQVAGEGGRFTLMSRRWSILGLANTVTVLIAGQVLATGSFPLNYQLIFIGSAVGGLISYIFSSSIRLPGRDAPAVRRSALATLRQHGETLRHNRRFVNFTATQFLLRWGISLSAPLLPIYWVRNVHASDAGISAINSTATAVTMVAYYLWARSSRGRGPRWVLLVTSLGIAFYPLLTALSNHIAVLVLWAAVAGFFQAGVDLVLFDILLTVCPPDDQPAYVGLYQTTLNLAQFLAPLVGTALADWIGIVPALVLATALRLMAFGLGALLKVGEEEPEPATLGIEGTATADAAAPPRAGEQEPPPGGALPVP